MGLGLAKSIFVWQKKPSNSVQKQFMVETALYRNCKIIFNVAGSSFLLSSKFELIPAAVEDLQL